MGDRHRRVLVAKRSGIVVGAEVRRKFHVVHFGMRLFVLGGCVVAVLGASVTAGIVYVHHKHVHDAAVARQDKLQKTVTDPNGLGDLDKLKSDSNSLIAGATSGDYDVSNAQLAQAYAARGDAELNSGDYKSAAADYQQAVQLDTSKQAVVGYGEFLARYHLGERQSLVPLLQTLEKPLKNNYDSQSQQQLAQYESYVTDLQAGKDLAL